MTSAAKNKKTLAALCGTAAAACLLWFTPQNEGRVLTTYRDLGGVLTYCDGATENAQWGKTYTPEQCNAQLDKDLVRHAEGIMRCLPWDRLTDGQKVAFVDTAYNIGIGAFCSSSMSRRAMAGDLPGACAALSMWNKVQGREVRGLTIRREKARAICEGKTKV